MIIIKGNLIWIIPLLIIIATASITLYTIYPMTEYFTQEEKIVNKSDISDMSEKELDDKIHETKKILDDLQKQKKSLGEKSSEPMEDTQIKSEKSHEKTNSELFEGKKKNEKEKNEKEKSSELFEEKKRVKEKFTSFDNSAEILRPNWRETNIPSTLEKYNGSIQGYNCGNYSEFTYNKPKWCHKFGECNSNNYEKPPGLPSSDDYIFPGRKQNRSGVIKYANRPHLLEHENDVNQKILEYESAPVFSKQKAENIKHLHYPQYMYHRRSGKLDPIITDANRFEVGVMNAFKNRTNEYSVM